MQLVKNLSASLSKIAPVMEVLSATSNGVYDLINDFEKFEQGLIEKNKSKDEQLNDFASSMMEQKGTYFEYNFISQLINESLQELKKKSGKEKENVLIIEDFDRLDPAHIFRILNIFSAHHFQDSNGNKFGFDKIIIVCHLDNIENIFRHFYGTKTDFEGYIDKFYSVEPFHFDNKQALTTYLRKKHKVDLPDYAIKCLAEILVFICNKENISLRKLFKTKLVPKIEEQRILTFELPQGIVRKPNYSEVSEFYITSNDLPLLYICRVLKSIFESYSVLLNRLEEYARHNIALNTNLEISASILKTMLLPNKLLNSEQNIRSIFFLDSGPFENPTYVYQNILFQVVYKWYPNNPYKGDCSFFEGVDYVLNGVLLSGSENSRASYRSAASDDFKITTSIFHSFSGFIKYAQKQGLLND